jgi:translation initiation factor 3 subunit H
MQALLKIVKHCQESLPNLVSGSLLGLVVQHDSDDENGTKKSVMEITHSFPFPSDQFNNKAHSLENEDDILVTGAATSASSTALEGAEDTVAGYDGHEYQMEMMRMLREVNVDNNCVGWYQSMYLGLYSTAAILENQFNYQTELSANSVVLLYDPMQTTHGQMVLKCLRLTEACVAQQSPANGKNTYLASGDIFEEIPITFTNPGLVQAFLADVADGIHPTTKAMMNPFSSGPGAKDDWYQGGGVEGSSYNPTHATLFDRLDLSTNPYLEKHLEFVTTFVEDLTTEQNKLQYYTRQVGRQVAASSGGKDARNKPPKQNLLLSDALAQAWAQPEAPRRLDSALLNHQIRTYVDQMDACASDGLSKLFLTSGLQQQQ